MVKKAGIIVISLSMAVLFSGAGATDDREKFLQEAREVVSQFGSDLRSHLQKEMKHGGPAGSITVCSVAAPALSSKLSRQTGWAVKRVSLKERNPLAIPDLWEQNILKKFEVDLADITTVDKLEHSEMVMEGGRRYFRYMKAIPTGDLCLHCHGPNESLSPDIQQILKKEYPHDKATGYFTGMIRGAFSIKRRMTVPGEIQYTR